MTKKMPQPARYEAQQRPCRAENCRETVSAVVALDDRGQEIEAATTRPSFCEAHNQRLIRHGEPKTKRPDGRDEWRECRECGSRFRPTETVSGVSTEYHCGAECAARALLRRIRKER